jgi:hypothetical protein
MNSMVDPFDPQMQPLTWSYQVQPNGQSQASYPADVAVAGNLTWGGSQHSFSILSGFNTYADGSIHQWGQVTFAAGGAANTVLTPVGGNPVNLVIPFKQTSFISTAKASLYGFSNGPQEAGFSITPFGLTGFNINMVSSVALTVLQTINWDMWGV